MPATQSDVLDTITKLHAQMVEAYGTAFAYAIVADGAILATSNARQEVLAPTDGTRTFRLLAQHKAQTRYTMRRVGWAIDAPFTAEGKRFLEQFRRVSGQRFKNARVREVLQLNPSRIPMHCPYKLGYL